MKFMITLSLLLFTFCVFAQPLPPSQNPVPLDGGIVALLAAGAAYGVKKLRTER